MQSRGIKKEDAIIMLVYAFINEINYSDKDYQDVIFKEVKFFFDKVRANE